MWQKTARTPTQRAASSIRQQLQGISQGMARGKVETLQHTLVDFVEVSFPDLTDFAQKQAKSLSNPETLEALTHKLFTASDAVMARHLLESVPEQPI